MYFQEKEKNKMRGEYGMNYIIEGCDCIGKSTLIDEFKLYQPQMEVRHCKNPPKDLNLRDQIDFQRNEYEEGIEDLNSGQFIIYDRFFLGEGVYAPMMRGYYPDYLRNLESKLNENTKLILLTTQNPQLVVDRFDNKFITTEQIPEVLRRFEQEYMKCRVKNKLRKEVDRLSPREIYLNVSGSKI